MTLPLHLRLAVAVRIKMRGYAVRWQYPILWLAVSCHERSQQ